MIKNITSKKNYENTVGTRNKEMRKNSRPIISESKQRFVNTIMITAKDNQTIKSVSDYLQNEYDNIRRISYLNTNFKNINNMELTHLTVHNITLDQSDSADRLVDSYEFLINILGNSDSDIIRNSKIIVCMFVTDFMMPIEYLQTIQQIAPNNIFAIINRWCMITDQIETRIYYEGTDEQFEDEYPATCGPTSAGYQSILDGEINQDEWFMYPKTITGSSDRENHILAINLLDDYMHDNIIDIYVYCPICGERTNGYNYRCYDKSCSDCGLNFKEKMLGKMLEAFDD